MVALATLFILVPSVPGFHGDPERRSLADLSLPIAAALLLVRIAINRYALRRQRALRETADPTERDHLAVPFRACGARRRDDRHRVRHELARRLARGVRGHGLTWEFLVAIVIVVIVGNATEHGSAVLLARRGRVRLATEISLASRAQVAGTFIPLVVLVSWAITPLALSFRPIELGALAISTALPALVLVRRRTTQLGGAILLVAYAGLVVAFHYSGNR